MTHLSATDEGRRPAKTLRRLLWAIPALATAGGLGFAGWLLALPPAPGPAAAPPVPQAEAEATLAALRPVGPSRPVVAVIGINDATETTDYLITSGILKRAGVAEVQTLATGPGPVRLYPALNVTPDATTAAFDARHPDGADYVIVPAMSRDDDPAALAWIRAQAAKGAVVIGVCAGAKVVAEAGLLDGKRATTHWYYLKRLLRTRPTIRYVPDRRFLADGKVVTTTGVTASIPAMLTLIEAIGGREKAEATARDLGVARWDARHASAAFRFNRPFALTVMGNKLAMWSHETLGLALQPGVDEVTLALVADAWSRTYRSRAITLSGSADPVPTRSGLLITPDKVEAGWPAGQMLPAVGARRPAQALDAALAAIEMRYGAATAKVVAMQLEYPRP
jgi:putative intracellular protease/amidase